MCIHLPFPSHFQGFGSWLLAPSGIPGACSTGGSNFIIICCRAAAAACKSTRFEQIRVKFMPKMANSCENQFSFSCNVDCRLGAGTQQNQFGNCAIREDVVFIHGILRQKLGLRAVHILPTEFIIYFCIISLERCFFSMSKIGEAGQCHRPHKWRLRVQTSCICNHNVWSWLRNMCAASAAHGLLISSAPPRSL